MSYHQPGRPQVHVQAAGPRAVRSATPPGGSVVIVAGAVLAVLAMLFVIMIERRQPVADPGASKSWVVPPVAEPEELIPLQSDPPSGAPSISPSPAATATSKPLPVSRPRASGTPSRAAARMLPETGSRLSLLATGTAGLRLRHQGFRMQIAAVGPSGSAGADATFVLRRGLADERCVSLESVNFPGRYVRHQNFVLVLQPRESSRLFAADATFCPHAAGTGGDFVLRSSNFPDRHVTADGSAVLLGKRSAGPAQRFHAGPGL